MIFEEVVKIIANYKEMDASEIKPESTFESLNLDSLDTVDLVMSFEDIFSISIEMNENIKKVSDIVEIIEKKV